jgi:hypothetical protein
MTDPEPTSTSNATNDSSTPEPVSTSNCSNGVEDNAKEQEEAKPSSETVTNNEVSAPEQGSEDEEPEEVSDSREKRINHWKESPFAVGNVHVTWADGRGSCWGGRNRSQADTQVCCSAFVCGCFGADRVGNMAVLAQTTEEYDHLQVNEETGEQSTSRRKRPRLLCVVGPYWPVNIFLTYPLIFIVSFWTAWMRVVDANIAIIVTWSFCTFLLVFSLAMVACRDPGILYRHSQRPPDAEDWRWNDQSRTFRPPNARFDPECQVVVESFDHT